MVISCIDFQMFFSLFTNQFICSSVYALFQMILAESYLLWNKVTNGYAHFLYCFLSYSVYSPINLFALQFIHYSVYCLVMSYSHFAMVVVAVIHKYGYTHSRAWFLDIIQFICKSIYTHVMQATLFLNNNNLNKFFFFNFLKSVKLAFKVRENLDLGFGTVINHFLI